MGININPYDGSKRPPPPPNPPAPPRHGYQPHKSTEGFTTPPNQGSGVTLPNRIACAKQIDPYGGSKEALVEALKPLARAADKAEARLAERRERDGSAHMSPSAHCGWGIKYRHALKARKVLNELGVNYND